MRRSLCTVVAVLGAVVSCRRVTALAKSNADGGDSYALDRPTFADNVDRVDNKHVGYIGEPVESSGFSTNDREKDCPSSCKCGVSKKSLGIIDGRPTSVETYPWMALIRTSASGICGGFVIKNQYVLTAAHCLYNKTGHKREARHLTVELLRFDEKKVKKFDVKYIIPHGNYDPKNMERGSDIALLRLDTTHRNLKFNDKSGVHPVCLPPKAPDDRYFKEEGIIIGWGGIHKNASYSDVLLEASVRIIPNDECKKNWPYVTHDMICTVDKKGEKRPCKGDSGGPLMIKKNNTYYVVGIVSHGCVAESLPSIYTKVDKFRNWLDNNTKEACSCSVQ